MKKMIFLLAIGCAAFAQANAQVTVGPELGLNFSSLSTRVNGINGDNGTRVGLKVGGAVDFAITPNISIQTGLYYDAMGAHERTSTSTVNEAGVGTVHDVKNDYRIDYLQIPANFVYKFGNPNYGQFFLGAGPYLAFALGGRVANSDVTTVHHANGTVTSTSTNTDYSLRIGNNANTDDVKGVDAGLNFNLGYEFAMGLFVRGNAGIGLVNIMPGGDDNNYMHNGSFTLSVGYLFGK